MIWIFKNHSSSLILGGWWKYFWFGAISNSWFGPSVNNRFDQQTKKELESIGCAVIPGFIKPESLLKMNVEAEKKLGGIHWTSDRNNPYFTKDDLELPKDHPKRFFEECKSGYITSDNQDPDSDLHTIFQFLELGEFLRRVLGLEQLFCFADPIAKYPYSIIKEGHYFPWHFDGTSSLSAFWSRKRKREVCLNLYRTSESLGMRI